MSCKNNDLAWFMDFMWADFEKVDAGELYKLDVELGLKTTGRPIAGPDPRLFGEKVAEAEAEVRFYDHGPRGEGRLRLLRLQTNLRRRFLEIIESVNQATKTGVPKLEVNFGTGSFSALSSEFYLARVEQQTLTTAVIPLKARPKDDSEQKLQLWPEGELKDETIQVWESAGSEAETIIYYFIRSLHGAKLSQIRNCPECGRYFFHGTKRDKIYCSNLCASRKNARDRRARMKEEEPDKYQDILEGNAERARASYEKKIRKLYAKVKIKRRPRNKKGD